MRTLNEPVTPEPRTENCVNNIAAIVAEHKATKVEATTGRDSAIREMVLGDLRGDMAEIFIELLTDAGCDAATATAAAVLLMEG